MNANKPIYTMSSYLAVILVVSSQLDAMRSHNMNVLIANTRMTICPLALQAPITRQSFRDVAPVKYDDQLDSIWMRVV